MSEQLAPPEAMRLKMLEHTISENGNKVAIALRQIRDERLYRQNYKSFSEYVAKRWLKTRSWADHMIKMAVVVEALPKKLRTTVRNESSARSLACVPVELREDTLKRINNSNHPVNSSTIPKAAAELIAKAKKPAHKVDRIGYKIPPHQIELWDRQHEIEDFIKQVRNLAKDLAMIGESEDLLWLGCNFQSAVSSLEMACSLIKGAIPHAVCPQCQGQITDKCGFCRGKGFINELQWGAVGKDKKELRSKAINDYATAS